MSYNGAQDIGTLKFLAANCIYQLNQSLMMGDDSEDRGALDDAVLLLDVVSSYQTEKDANFHREMQAIVRDRQAAKQALKPGMELTPELLEGFRWRELKAMFRCLCRQGTFVRQESPNATWKPEVKA